MKCKLMLGAWNGSVTSRDFLPAIPCDSEDDAIAIFRARKAYWASFGYVPYGCYIYFEDNSKKAID